MLARQPQHSRKMRAPIAGAVLAAALMSGCVAGDEATTTPKAMELQLDGKRLSLRQEAALPVMILPVDAGGRSVLTDSGKKDRTVVIAGAGRDRDLAIRALGQFCGRAIPAEGFDTQFVYQEPESGDWWFDGFC